ncbi:MAG: response regulator [Desulfuromonadales bacterium]|nr:response regulator [Desulfuromonadales bacterium]
MSKIPGRILVVDDDLFTAELTGLILETVGYETVIAEGGIDALEKIAADPWISIIVSDMNMPFMNGIQLFEEVRQQGYSQPFVLLTGEEAAPLREANPEMDGILTKDEHLQELLPDMVALFLGRA